jgi:putative nucleotidyltransferase with HDIG domain
MLLLRNERVIDILKNALDCVDARLIDHGKRVAYLVYKILKSQNIFTDKQLRDICILAMLHDVGAYKTEEIDKMVIFETRDVWEHSIYGYLFLKYFSPLKELSQAILFHHADCNELINLDNPACRMLAQLISLCDRADIFALNNVNDAGSDAGSDAGFRDYINKYRGIKYRNDIADMFLSSRININVIFDEVDSDGEFNHVFYDTPLSSEEVIGYINMIIYSIDFRSSQTVFHTVATAYIAGMLAELMNVDKDEIIKIKTGAMLHDIGKNGIPIHILESTEKLNDTDMAIMRGHVEITERILDGNVDDEIKDIAVKHHEKLNGSGYPKKLNSGEIAFFDRIVAIADIFSALCGARSYKNAFSKDRIVGILSDMSGQNLIDSNITSIAINHFEEIKEGIERESTPVIQTYNAMNEEYLKIMNDIIEGAR